VQASYAGDPDVGLPAESSGPVPAKKAARKRASRTATAQASESTPDVAPAAAPEVAPDVADEDVAVEPAAAGRRPRRARASSRAASAPAAVPAAAAEPTLVEDQPTVDEDAEALPVQDGDVPALAEHPEGSPAAGQAADVPSFGVVFQAPVPATSRRASAPSTAPPSQAVVAAAADLAALEDGLEAQSRPDAASAEVDDDRTPAGSRRRRGGTRSAERTAEGPVDRAVDRGVDAPDQLSAEPEDDRPLASTETPTDTGTGTVGGTFDDSAEGEEESSDGPRRRRRRGGKGRRGRGGDSGTADDEADSGSANDSSDVRDDVGDGSGSDRRKGDDQGSEDEGDIEGGTRRRTRRRRRSGSSSESEETPGVVTRVREPRRERERGDEVTGLKGSTRLEAKKQRRREGREAGRRRTVITEAEFLARRESVERVMVVRTKGDRTQIGVLEDGVLVEHYISRETTVSMAGNIYLGRVQNVLPSMEAAFVDIGKGRNAVLYAGEVNWDAAGMESNQPKRIENALSSGESVLVQVTKDPIGHKGARLTSQISLPGRYLVYVPDSSMTGISRKLPDTERARLKKILKEVVPESAGVIVRTAAEGASEEELRADVERLTSTWEEIRSQAESAGSGKGKGKGGGSAPLLLHGESDLTVRVIRDVFNEDFTSLVVAGQQAWDEVSDYVSTVAPDLAERVTRWTSEEDLFTHYRVDEQIAKAMDRKVWLPSGGSLVIDRTEAMTVIDVNTGKFIGSGGNLEETVTKNNIEAAEEIVRQLRLRDIGGIIVVDFIDMVLESNRELVIRRLLECLGRDRTKHQVAEVTSLGLVQMTRKRVGSGLIEVFGEMCEHCNGRGIIVHADPVEKGGTGHGDQGAGGWAGSSRSTGTNGSGVANDPSSGRGGTRGRRGKVTSDPVTPPRSTGPTPAQIAAAAHAAALKASEPARVDASAGSTPEPAADSAQPGQPDVADQADLTHVGASADDQQRDLDLVSEILVVEDRGQHSAPTLGEQTPDVAVGVVGEEVPAPGAEVAPEAVLEPVGQPVTEAVRQAPTEPATEHVASEPAPEPVTQRVTEPVPEQAVAAPSRGRRRRGRVVAPAGPPRAFGSEHLRE
jgi:ribonuclease E